MPFIGLLYKKSEKGAVYAETSKMQKARSCRGEVMKRAELESFIMETYNAETDLSLIHIFQYFFLHSSGFLLFENSVCNTCH